MSKLSDFIEWLTVVMLAILALALCAGFTLAVLSVVKILWQFLF